MKLYLSYFRLVCLIGLLVHMSCDIAQADGGTTFLAAVEAVDGSFVLVKKGFLIGEPISVKLEAKSLHDGASGAELSLTSLRRGELVIFHYDGQFNNDTLPATLEHPIALKTFRNRFDGRIVYMKKENAGVNICLYAFPDHLLIARVDNDTELPYEDVGLLNDVHVFYSRVVVGSKPLRVFAERVGLNKKRQHTGLFTLKRSLSGE